MHSTKIVTCFVKNNDRFLLLRRSYKVRTMKGLWAAISGIIEKDEDPLKRAKIEIYEEIGAKEDSLRLLKAGKEITIQSPQYQDHQWIVFPFLFELGQTEITLNWENSAFKWISPQEIYNYKTVPQLDVVLFSLL